MPNGRARREGREEQLVERRRAEALSPAGLEPRVGGLEEVGERHARGRLVLERAVAVVADAPREVQAVEEGQLVLEDDGPGVDGLLVAPLDLAHLVPVLAADRDRVPRDGLDEVVPVGLESPRGDVGGEAERMRGIGLVLELERLVDARHPDLVLPDRRPGLAPLEGEEPELLVLLSVRVEVGEDRGERNPEMPVLVPPGERHLALVRQRVADPRVHAGDVVLVVVELALEVEPAHPEGVAPRPSAPRHAHALPEGLVVARLEIHETGRRPFAALGDDVDHAADRVRAVEGRLRAAQDLDPLDVVEGEVGEVEVAGGEALDPHAVDQHLHLRRVGPADADGRELAGAPGRLDLDARDRPEDLLHCPVLLDPHRLLGDDASPTRRSPRAAARSIVAVTTTGSARRTSAVGRAVVAGAALGVVWAVSSAPTHPAPSHSSIASTHHLLLRVIAHSSSAKGCRSHAARSVS